MVLLIWIGASFLVAYGASNSGRNPGGWFLLSLFFSPLLAGIVLLLLPTIRSEVVESGTQVQAGDLRMSSVHYVEQLRKSWSLVKRNVVTHDEHYAKVKELHGAVARFGIVGTDTDILAGAADLVDEGVLTPGDIVLLKASLERAKNSQESFIA